MRYEDVIGTDEYRESDSLTDGREENEIGEEELDVSGEIDLDDSGSGFGGSMSCPADISMNIPPFGQIVLPFTFICEWAAKIRPIVIAMGWLIAGFIVFRSMTEN